MLVARLGAVACYPYYRTKKLLKIAEANIKEVLPEVPYDPPNTKRQKLIKCVLTGNSKQYLEKAYTEERIDQFSEEEVDKLFSNYEAKLSGQIVKSLGANPSSGYIQWELVQF